VVSMNNSFANSINLYNGKVDKARDITSGNAALVATSSLLHLDKEKLAELVTADTTEYEVPVWLDVSRWLSELGIAVTAATLVVKGVARLVGAAKSAIQIEVDLSGDLLGVAGDAAGLGVINGAAGAAQALTAMGESVAPEVAEAGAEAAAAGAGAVVGAATAGVGLVVAAGVDVILAAIDGAKEAKELEPNVQKLEVAEKTLTDSIEQLKTKDTAVVGLTDKAIDRYNLIHKTLLAIRPVPSEMNLVFDSAHPEDVIASQKLMMPVFADLIAAVSTIRNFMTRHADFATRLDEYLTEISDVLSVDRKLVDNAWSIIQQVDQAAPS